MRVGNRAFSLIELLVVVSIIALLSAIAAVNYQQAIARSKISRFMADARALEAAIEAYNADANRYPPAEQYPIGSNQEQFDINIPSPTAGFTPRLLTTPISYMSRLPFDVFRNQNPAYNPSNFPERRTYQYANDFQNAATFGVSSDAFYVSQIYALLTTTTPRPRLSERMSNAVWMISSPGMDGDADHGWNPTWSGNASATGGIGQDVAFNPVTYDPSNGVISDGDLFMFGPGLGFPGK